MSPQTPCNAAADRLNQPLYLFGMSSKCMIKFYIASLNLIYINFQTYTMSNLWNIKYLCHILHLSVSLHMHSSHRKSNGEVAEASSFEEMRKITRTKRQYMCFYAMSEMNAASNSTSGKCHLLQEELMCAGGLNLAIHRTNNYFKWVNMCLVTTPPLGEQHL